MPSNPSVSVIVTNPDGKALAGTKFAQAIESNLIGVYDVKEFLFYASSERLEATGVIIVGEDVTAFQVLICAINAGIGALFDRALLISHEWRLQILDVARRTHTMHKLFCFPTQKNAHGRRTVRNALKSGKIGRVLAADAINTTQALNTPQNVPNPELLNLWDYTEVFHDLVGPYREIYASGIGSSAEAEGGDTIGQVMIAGYLASGALAVEYHSGTSPLSRDHELITIYGTDGALRCDYAKQKAFIARRNEDFEEMAVRDCCNDMSPELAFAALVAAHPQEAAGAREALLPLEDAIAIARKLDDIEAMIRSSPHSDLQCNVQNGYVIDKLAWLYLVDGKCLVTRSKGKSLWYIPGGKREEKENDIEALVREVREELSVELESESLSYVGAFYAQADGKAVGVKVKMSCYAGANFSGALQADNEIEEYDWFTFADIEKVSHVDRVIFNYLKSKGRLR